MRSIVLSVFAACAANVVFGAAQVKSVQVRSEAMAKDVPVTVVLPGDYGKNPAKRYPVIYCFHGCGGDENSYVTSNLCEFVEREKVIFVAPNGAKSSWWIDSPVDPAMKYETFPIKELLPYVDKTYATIPDRAHRVTMGGSMGGHGAAYLALRHRDLFGAVAILFGAVDVRPFPPHYWKLQERFGDKQANRAFWDANMVSELAKDLKNGELSILQIIGTNDSYFLQVNRKFHKQLVKDEIEHVYVEIRGEDKDHSAHNGIFRQMAMPVMLNYLNNFFREGKGRL